MFARGQVLVGDLRVEDTRTNVVTFTDASGEATQLGGGAMLSVRATF